jgi:hypothetical protein
MAYEYTQEIRDQQAVVKRELEKLGRMRREHLIATGQMPTAQDVAAYLKENGLALEKQPRQQESSPS